MADAVEWADSYFRDQNRPQTLEDAVRFCAAFAGVHEFQFQNRMEDAFSDLADWDIESGMTATAASGYLDIDGGGTTNKWYQLTYTGEEIPPSFVVSFDYISGRGGFFFNGNPVNRESFLMWISDSTWCGASYTSSTGNSIGINALPTVVNSPSRIQFLVRYSLDSVDDERKWLQGAVFENGLVRTSFAKDVGGTALDWDGHNVGFCVFQDDNFKVDNVTISTLHRGVEWVLIDPGQPAASGMTRAIGSTRVVYMCRYNDVMQVWRPGNRDLDFTYPSVGRRDIQAEGRKNINIPNHIRVQAALHEVDVFNNDLNEDYMHRFALHNDPNIMTDDEAYNEGIQVQHDQKERGEVMRILGPPNYLLEPNDRILYNGQYWRVKTISLGLSMTANGMGVQSSTECQRYIEDHDIMKTKYSLTL